MGENAHIKAACRQLIPHLETTCEIHHINGENVLIIRTRELSAVADSAEPKQYSPTFPDPLNFRHLPSFQQPQNFRHLPSFGHPPNFWHPPDFHQAQGF
jgi:hypothetical protein